MGQMFLLFIAFRILEYSTNSRADNPCSSGLLIPFDRHLDLIHQNLVDEIYPGQFKDFLESRVISKINFRVRNVTETMTIPFPLTPALSLRERENFVAISEVFRFFGLIQRTECALYSEI
jgi:hypothetical protein